MADFATNEVSWQSLFWALIPIALNSMTQPCGRIYGFSEEYGFFLRSSPIICAYDVISTFVSFVYHLIESKSFRKALLGVMLYRFGHTYRESGSGGLQDLQKNSPPRLFLFVAGALPQLIKIYAFAGVQWTKVWASLYLVSFGLLEILVISQRKPLVTLRSESLGHLDNRNIFTYDAFMSVFQFALLIIYISCFVALAQLVNLEPYLTLPFGAIMFSSTLSVARNIIADGESRDTIQASLMALIQINLLLLGHPTLLESHKGYKLLCFACSHGICACFSPRPTRFWFWLRREHFNMYQLFIIVSKVYIVLLNFSFGLICYTLFYDPIGTVKPKWTENLG